MKDAGPKRRPIKHPGGLGPPPYQWTKKQLETIDATCQRIAEIGLEHYNTNKAPYTGDGATYELVETRDSTSFIQRMTSIVKAHSNFTAKPVHSNGPTMLFFTELSSPVSSKKPFVATNTTVHSCCLLGCDGEG
ncbi:unnamed protein product, partial [Cuscuta europaea]